jgi:hypothetical protein
MSQIKKTSNRTSAPGSTDPVGNMADMTERLGLSSSASPVPAAWPTGVSQLAQAIEACQRCDTAEVCTDWLNRAPNVVEQPPEFCPNAPEFRRVKAAKKR